LYRYQQRCQWFDATRLRELAADGPGKSEDRLTSTLAMYLFDLGLNPLTRPMFGNQQPDIYHGGAPFSFYVEAKQYDDNKSRGELLTGMNQIWDMLNQIKGTAFDVREAFLVVYRRSGPIYHFPDRVEHEGRVVFPVLVNIAEMTESGARAPKPILIEKADLMPVRGVSG
jgi:hypothetical protein